MLASGASVALLAILASTLSLAEDAEHTVPSVSRPALTGRVLLVAEVLAAAAYARLSSAAVLPLKANVLLAGGQSDVKP